VLFLFLQSCGWYVLPNSRKKDTMAFEYLVVNPKTAEPATVQVKTGRTFLDRDDYVQWPQRVFLFQANNLYAGDQHPNVTTFDPEEVRTFLCQASHWLPQVIRKKLAIVQSYQLATCTSENAVTSKLTQPSPPTQAPPAPTSAASAHTGSPPQAARTV
jgi:hypothetical protein